MNLAMTPMSTSAPISAAVKWTDSPSSLAPSLIDAARFQRCEVRKLTNVIPAGGLQESDNRIPVDLHPK